MDPILITAVICALLGVAVMWRRLHLDRKRFLEQRDEWRQRLQDESNQIQIERNRLLDALGDAFMIIDNDRRISFANTAAGELFHGRELVGRTIMEAFLDQRLSAALNQCLETGERVKKRVILPRQALPREGDESGGDTAWVVDAAPIPDHSGDGDHTRVVIRDVTTDYQTEQVRKDFVANASHELRTPLAIINGYLENLIDDSVHEDPELTLRFLKVMRKHSTRIARIIEDMLVISRLESGEAAALKIKPFPFRGCIDDVIERLESVISAQQAQVRVKMKDTELRILGDRFYWTQVMFNLVENALKQNPRPGLKITVGCARRGKGVEIRVADNGIGIPNSDLPFIFKRFYRVEKHHSQEEIKGTGLGLSIVKRAVEAHHGEITVTSTPGQETRFTIELPATVAFTGEDDSSEKESADSPT